MDIHIERVKSGQQSCQFRRDNPGKGAGNPGADSDNLDMTYFSQLLQDFPQSFDREQEGVSSRKKHIPNLLIPANVAERRRQVCFVTGAIRVRLLL